MDTKILLESLNDTRTITGSFLSNIYLTVVLICLCMILMVFTLVSFVLGFIWAVVSLIFILAVVYLLIGRKVLNFIDSLKETHGAVQTYIEAIEKIEEDPRGS